MHAFFTRKISSKSNHRRPVLYHFSKTNVWSSRDLLGASGDGADGSVRWTREKVNY